MSLDRWSPLSVVVRRLLAVPDPIVERLLRGAPPVEVDGRVLDRRVQLLLRGTRADPTRDLDDIERTRTTFVRLARLALPLRAGIVTSDRVVDAGATRLRVRIYRRPGLPRPSPAILFLHGGGWWKGDLESGDRWCRLAADEGRCGVVSVDYRRPPEDVFPAAAEDALAAWAWLAEHAGELGFDVDRLGVAGESAGGNLAAVVAQQAQVRGLRRPSVQALVYPALDLRMETASITTFAHGFGLDRPQMEAVRARYAPDPAHWLTPLASPMLADDLTGLPPALIVTAGFDPLRDDGTSYASRLASASVPVDLRCEDSAIHGFASVGLLPGGMDVVLELCAAIGALVRRGGPGRSRSCAGVPGPSPRLGPRPGSPA